jgi:hypothetical protein
MSYLSFTTHNSHQHVQSKLKYVKGNTSHTHTSHSFILMLATSNAYRAHRRGFTPHTSYFSFVRGKSLKPVNPKYYH